MDSEEQMELTTQLHKRQFSLTAEQIEWLDTQVAAKRREALDTLSGDEFAKMPFINRSTVMRELIDQARV